MIEQQHAEWQECQPLSVAPDGALVVNLGGLKQELELTGIELIRPSPAAYFELVSRLHSLPKAMRCRVVGRTQTDRVRAEVLYFAWQDKSGDVWINLATTLVEQGLARPVEGQMKAP